MTLQISRLVRRIAVCTSSPSSTNLTNTEYLGDIRPCGCILGSQVTPLHKGVAAASCSCKSYTNMGNTVGFPHPTIHRRTLPSAISRVRGRCGLSACVFFRQLVPEVFRPNVCSNPTPKPLPGGKRCRRRLCVFIAVVVVRITKVRSVSIVLRRASTAHGVQVVEDGCCMQLFPLTPLSFRFALFLCAMCNVPTK